MVEKALLKAKKLSNKKIKTGESLKDILAYSGVSLWRFIESPVRLRLKSDKDRKVTDKKILINLISLLLKNFLIMKFLFRAAFGHLFAKRSRVSHPDRRKIIVSSSLDKWGETTNTLTLKTRKEDTMLGTIIDALKRDNFSVLGLDRDDNKSIDMRRFLDKLIYGRETWRPIETYITLGMIINALDTSKKIEKNWERFLQSLKDEDKKLFSSLSGGFKIIFVYHIFQAIMYMKLTRRAIELEKPKLMVVSCENSSSGRAMIIVGKLTKVPTLAIQHGFFTSHFIRYFHEAKEISNKISPQYVQLADKTAVFGPRFKRLLTQISNYTPKSVVVTGQPRYDILIKSDKIFSRTGFCKKHNLSSDKRIMLITTYPSDQLFPLSDKEIFLRSILRSLTKFNEVEIVIKPHPEENEAWHKKLVREERVKATILPRTYNTYEALYACDVMMTVASTTVIEAIILDKPVIIADLINHPDAPYYIKTGAVLGVYKSENLDGAIKKALYDKKIIKKLKKSRKKFIYQHAYKQDGKATERVVNLIKKMIRVATCIKTKRL